MVPEFMSSFVPLPRLTAPSSVPEFVTLSSLRPVTSTIEKLSPDQAGIRDGVRAAVWMAMPLTVPTTLPLFPISAELRTAIAASSPPRFP